MQHQEFIKTRKRQKLDIQYINISAEAKVEPAMRLSKSTALSITRCSSQQCNLTQGFAVGIYI